MMHRQCAVLLLSAYRIVYRAGTMASLVKGQGGSQRHAVSFHAQTLQEACHMAVVADVVALRPYNGLGRRGGKGKRFASKVWITVTRISSTVSCPAGTNEVTAAFTPSARGWRARPVCHKSPPYS